jgi:hypothetical protein
MYIFIPQLLPRCFLFSFLVKSTSSHLINRSVSIMILNCLNFSAFIKTIKYNKDKKQLFDGKSAVVSGFGFTDSLRLSHSPEICSLILCFSQSLNLQDY